MCTVEGRANPTAHFHIHQTVPLCMCISLQDLREHCREVSASDSALIGGCSDCKQAVKQFILSRLFPEYWSHRTQQLLKQIRCKVRWVRLLRGLVRRRKQRARDSAGPNFCPCDGAPGHWLFLATFPDPISYWVGQCLFLRVRACCPRKGVTLSCLRVSQPASQSPVHGLVGWVRPWQGGTFGSHCNCRLVMFWVLVCGFEASRLSLQRPSLLWLRHLPGCKH